MKDMFSMSYSGKFSWMNDYLNLHGDEERFVWLQSHFKSVDRDSLLPIQPVKENQSCFEDFCEKPYPKKLCQGLSLKEKKVVLEAIFAHQGHIFSEEPLEKQRHLLDLLLELEDFYQPIGGVLGYCVKSHETLLNQVPLPFEVDLPNWTELSDISSEQAELGWEALEHSAICLPIGGAGDRLGYEVEGEAMPVALYPFAHKTLLEEIFTDIWALELLYKKKFDRDLTLPVVLMVSDEKGGYEKISSFLERQNYFNRHQSSITMIKQIQVPVFNEEGRWIMTALGEVWRKPAGHGSLWQEGARLGVWSELFNQGVKHLAIRQINNPLAWTKHKLIDLLALHVSRNSFMTFLSCPREVGRAEGMQVSFKDRFTEQSWISNVEYVDLHRYGIEDRCMDEVSNFSIYPSNTNVFTIDLQSILKMHEYRALFPKSITNIKPMCLENSSEKIPAGRLESMMQNIADIPAALQGKVEMKNSSILYAPRPQTISVIKKELLTTKAWGQAESASGAFTSLMHFYMTRLKSFGNQFEKHSDLACIYLHPAIDYSLGVFHQTHEGSLIEGSWFSRNFLLWLSVSKAKILNSSLMGALSAFSKPGFMTELTLTDCAFSNQKSIQNIQAWHEEVWQVCESSIQAHDFSGFIVLFEGRGSFIARGLYLKGEFTIEVPDGYTLELTPLMEGDKGEPLSNSLFSSAMTLILSRLYQKGIGAKLSVFDLS